MNKKWRNEQRQGGYAQQNWNSQYNHHPNHRDPRLQQQQQQQQQNVPRMKNMDASWYNYKKFVMNLSMPFLEEVANYRHDGRSFSQVCSLLPYEMDVILQKHLHNFITEVFQHKFANLSNERSHYQQNQSMAQEQNNNIGGQFQQQIMTQNDSPPAQNFSNATSGTLQIKNVYQVNRNVFMKFDELFKNTQHEKQPPMTEIPGDQASFIDISSLGREKTDEEIRNERLQRPNYRQNTHRGFADDSGWEGESNETEKAKLDANKMNYSATKFQAVPLEPPSRVSLSKSSKIDEPPKNSKKNPTNSKRKSQQLEVEKGKGLQVTKSNRNNFEPPMKIKVEPGYDDAYESDETVMDAYN